MKKYLLPLILAGFAASASASTYPDAVTLPEMRAVDAWDHTLVLQHMEPVYPPALLRTGTEGRVRLEIEVDRAGKVTAIHVLERDDPAFIRAVRSAVWHWKFAPSESTASVEHRRAHITFQFMIEEAA